MIAQYAGPSLLGSIFQEMQIAMLKLLNNSMYWLVAYIDRCLGRIQDSC